MLVSFCGKKALVVFKLVTGEASSLNSDLAPENEPLKMPYE